MTVFKSPSLEGRGKGRDFFRGIRCRTLESLPHPLPSREGGRGGFTLIEILLAISLTSVVMFLLTSAIELFMVRMETSRGRVESSQLARTILDQMAADLANARLYAPRANTPSSGSGSGQTGGTPSGGGQNSGQAAGSGGASSGGTSPGGSASTAPTFDASDVNGLYGNVEEIRIDRAAYSNWERSTREVDPEETASIADMPLSVRYYLHDGDFYSTQRMAQRGTVEEETSGTIAGLYREITPTASLADQDDPLASTSQNDSSKAELVASEVVKLELAYFDGDQLIKEWDSYDEKGLPAGVEIRLTLYEPSARTLADDELRGRAEEGRFGEEDLVEYRRFVRIPNISPPQEADLLLPAQEEGGQAGAAQQGGGAGQGSGQDGGQQNGGQQGGQNNQNNSQQGNGNAN